MNEDRYFECSCPKCGWVGSSRDVAGGEPLGETGDYGELYCPACIVGDVYTIVDY